MKIVKKEFERCTKAKPGSAWSCSRGSSSHQGKIGHACIVTVLKLKWNEDNEVASLFHDFT